MEFTLTERILAALSDPDVATMSLAQIVSEEIREFKASEQYRNMVEADRYYRNRSDVQNKTVSLANRSNTKIEQPVLKKLTDQKTNFLLAKPWSVATENKAYADALNTVLDDAFRQKIKYFGKAAITSGIAWLHPYFEDGRMGFMRIPSSELIPLWLDSEHSKLSGFIRFYDQTVYIGTRKHTVSHAEFWWDGGVRYFKTDAYTAGIATNYYVDKEHGTPENDYTEPHFTVDKKPYNWDEVPIVWLKYNEEELPLCYFVKEMIDDINWQTSTTADVLRDVAKFIFVLRNYGGADLKTFVKELQETLAIQVDGDGGVDKLQADLNVDAVMTHMEQIQRRLYDYAGAVDFKDPDVGNASGTAIQLRYQGLQTDCEALGAELKAAFRRLKMFLDTYFQITGKGDFRNETFDVIFNMDLPINEADVINNIRNSESHLSLRTRLENHPWVKDVDEEIRRIQDEKQEAMKEFGDGLFDDTHVDGSGDDQ